MTHFCFTPENIIANNNKLDCFDISRDSILLESLIEYYHSTPQAFEWLINIISNKNVRISLRIVDWFVTNYSRFNNDNLDSTQNIHKFYSGYKSQLKQYNKRLFDPFSRIAHKNNIHRFDIQYNNTCTINTTVGQLNFFKWAYESNVLDYIQNNLEIIKVKNKQYEKNKPKCTTSETLPSSSSSSGKSKKIYQNIPMIVPSLLISFV